MSEPSLPTTPLLSKVKMSQPMRHSSRRVNQCTHGRITRVWDKYDCFKCFICHQASSFGYLYRCTQDMQGNLPDSDFTDLVDSFEGLGINIRPTTASNSSFIASSISSSFPTTTTISTNTSLDSTTPAMSGEDLAQHHELEAASGLLVVKNPAPPSTCEFKVCPACRPVYRDRAWQSIDKILSESVRLPSGFEMDNRPISDSRTLSTMDYSPQRFYANIPEILIGEAEDQSIHTCSQENSSNDSDDKSGYIEIGEKKEHPLKQTSNVSPSSAASSEYDADTEEHDETSTKTDVDNTDMAKWKRPSFLQNVAHSTSSLLKLDHKEKRAGRRLTKGRFFID